jgi:hypothetical protein
VCAGALRTEFTSGEMGPDLTLQVPLRRYTAEEFRSALARHGVRHRYGAIGRSGSIAVIERFFRTLKALAQTRERPPLFKADLERRLAVAFDYYAWLRPHQGLEGRTPAEIFLERRPAHLDAVPPPRGRPGERVEFTGVFEVRYLDPEQPFLIRRAA